MRQRERRHGAPIGDYTRAYRLVPEGESDYLAYVQRKLAARGFHVLDTGWWQQPDSTAGYVFVAVWARKRGKYRAA